MTNKRYSRPNVAVSLSYEEWCAVLAVLIPDKRGLTAKGLKLCNAAVPKIQAQVDVANLSLLRREDSE